jgi:hypothetical protein
MHNNKQLNNNVPNINIHPFTKNLNVLDVDNMDTIREDGCKSGSLKERFKFQEAYNAGPVLG